MRTARPKAMSASTRLSYDGLTDLVGIPSVGQPIRRAEPTPAPKPKTAHAERQRRYREKKRDARDACDAPELDWGAA